MQAKLSEFFQEGTLSASSKIIDRLVILQVLVGLILVLLLRHEING